MTRASKLACFSSTRQLIASALSSKIGSFSKSSLHLFISCLTATSLPGLILLFLVYSVLASLTVFKATSKLLISSLAAARLPILAFKESVIDVPSESCGIYTLFSNESLSTLKISSPTLLVNSVHSIPVTLS